MIRGHQFNKVEMVQYTKPEDSDRAFQELVGKAERLVQELGLHYRLSRLAAGDCSASMARTYDIEVWIPSMGIYKEVSSRIECARVPGTPRQHQIPRRKPQAAVRAYAQRVGPCDEPCDAGN